MNRNILKFLNIWKNKGSRRPLLLRGARQVGKTWSIREHGKSYDYFVELNLDERPEFAKPFQELYGQPDRLIQAIQNLLGIPVIPGKTLVFIDEIQDYHEALKALRYFKEKLPALHVIAAGSLLEFSLKDHSFPVGRIEFAHLFPLNFAEFLQAKRREDLLARISKMSPERPPDRATHDMLLEECATFSLLGGMPEVVKTFVDGGTLDECQALQQVILATYREDFYKYASRAKIEYLRKTFDNAPRLLGQKFKYSNIDREARSRELGEALNLLVDAGLVYKATHTAATGVPLSAQEKPEKFKVYFVDSGLCARILGIRLADILSPQSTLNHLTTGGLAEQLVAQELVSLTPPNHRPALHYWHREAKSAKAEVDFIFEQGQQLIPIEVKSSTGGSMKSLHLFMAEKSAYISAAVKISSASWSQQGKVLNLPFYAVHAIVSTAKLIDG